MAVAMRSLCLITLSMWLGLAMTGRTAQELDVVSVRESDTRDSLPRFEFLPRRIVVANVPLQSLVAFAFGLSPGLPRERQIEGWPDRSLRDRRFTVMATHSGTSTPPLAVQRRLVREILENRFGMRTRIEQREQPVYALRLLEPGVLGPGIVEVDYDCTDPETRAGRDVEDCRLGSRNEARGAVDRGSGPIGVLVALLQGNLPDRVVVDQTGLDAFYDWSLLWMERGVRLSRPPSVHDVVGVQLGMTLADTRAPVDVVVIEAISTPAPN